MLPASRRTSAAICATLVVAWFVTASPAYPADVRTGSVVTIEQNEVIEDDLYVAGGTVTIGGVIYGDVVAAGGAVTVTAEVHGSVIAAGGTLRVLGTVRDSVRTAGGDTTIASSIGRDVVAAGGNIVLDAGAAVGRDVLAGGGSIRLAGRVARNVSAGGGTVTLAGPIGGRTQVGVGSPLVVEADARLEGDLLYTSAHEAQIATAANVAGVVQHRLPTRRIFGVEMEETLGTRILASIVAQLRWFLGMTIVGLLLLWLFPATFRGAAETVLHAPWRSLGLGLLVLVAAPAVVVLLGLAGIVVGGFAAAPVLAVPAAVYLALLLLSAPVVALAIGALLLSGRENPRAGWQGLLLGAFILAVVGLVPFVAWAVFVLAVLVGFGAWLLLLARRYAQGRRELHV